MGRFQCVNCQCTYHSKRFFWEKDQEDACVFEDVCQCGATFLEGSKFCRICGEPRYEQEASWQDSDFEIESDYADECKVCDIAAEHNLLEPNLVDRMPKDYTDLMSEASTEAPPQDVATGEASHSWASKKKISLQRIAAHADVVRATGTAANVLGTAAPVLHVALAPFSVAGGCVGAVSGAAQLRKGLSTPSGIVDPHLVTKGAVTTSVGSCCMGLAAAASVFPGIFPVALSLGLVGLGVATTVDANMDGLCEHCRDYACPPRSRTASGCFSWLRRD